MTDYPALTLHQPWAQLLALGIKTIETRSWAAPAGLIGQRIAIHASAKALRFEHRNVNDDLPMWVDRTERHLEWTEHDDFHHGGVFRWIGPLGAVVGSGVLTACVPMTDGCGPSAPHLCLNYALLHSRLSEPWPNGETEIDVSGQLPFGDFAPGRFAWLFDDLAPTTERCPACWGTGDHDEGWDPIAEEWIDDDLRLPCTLCAGAGRCQPIPARGRQRVWKWTPGGAP